MSICRQLANTNQLLELVIVSIERTLEGAPSARFSLAPSASHPYFSGRTLTKLPPPISTTRANSVSANKRNINVIRNLLADIKQTIQKYSCWGRPIGSSALWQQHFETIERISQIVDEIELSPVSWRRRRLVKNVACLINGHDVVSAR